MQTNEILDRLENAKSARGLAAKVDDPSFGRVYLDRVLSYYGTDNKALLSLGRHWRTVANAVQEPAYAYRVGGIYERARGKWLASAQAFDTAGELFNSGPERWSFRVGAIDSFARAGRIGTATELANRVVQGLRDGGENGQAARALLNLGNALVYQDEMAQARSVLEMALPDLESGGFALEAASCRLALSSTHLFGGDPTIAKELAQEVVQASADLGADYLQDLAQLNLALALIVTGRPDQALDILFELRESLEDSAVDAARVHEYLGDAYHRLNLWPEAVESYEAAISGSGHDTPLHRANLQLGLGHALHASGKPALQHFKTAARLYRRIQNSAWEGASRIGLAKAGTKASKVELKKALQLTEKSPFHRCECLLELAELEPGSSYLGQAEKLIDRYGYSGIAWRVPYLRARSSANPGRHFRTMFRLILASRLSTVSLVSRMSFLQDKTQAIRAYLDWLLAKPSRKRIDEAVSVIEQSRAITLLEEFATRSSLPPGFLERLDDLRLALASVDEDPRGARRHTPLPVAGLGRMAAEAVRQIEDALPSVGGAEPATVLFESGKSIHILRKGHPAIAALSSKDMSEKLRWLAFELLAPMAEPDTDGAEAENLLCGLGKAFRELWRSDDRRICPDGSLWRIPWTAASMASGHEGEWQLSLHPRMAGKFSGGLEKGASVLILFGRSLDLPFAEKEVQEIVGLFPNHRLATTVRQAQESLNGTYDAVHVVSHAIHRAENPMFSSIEFEDGPLFATELARSKLSIRLATLSACETGSMSLAMRDEPDGLARAFLARGAQSVIASQWPLNDEAAFRQFGSIYCQLLDGIDSATALFNARCICRQWRGHPYYWGALALYAGYA